MRRHAGAEPAHIAEALSKSPPLQPGTHLRIRDASLVLSGDGAAAIRLATWVAEAETPAHTNSSFHSSSDKRIRRNKYHPKRLWISTKGRCRWCARDGRLFDAGFRAAWRRRWLRRAIRSLRAGLEVLLGDLVEFGHGCKAALAHRDPIGRHLEAEASRLFVGSRRMYGCDMRIGEDLALLC